MRLTRFVHTSAPGSIRAPSIGTTTAVLVVGLALFAVACTTSKSATTLPPLTVDRSALDTRRNGAPELIVVAPAEGSSVVSPVEITVDVENYTLAAKGVSKDGEGHFHVVQGDCIDPGEVIGDDHTHIGDGAASVMMELPPGEIELCLQLGDGFHTALAITQTLNVTVLDTNS